MTRLNLDVIADEDARAPYEVDFGGRTWRLPHPASLTLRQQLDADNQRIDLVARTTALVLVPGEDGAEDTWEPAGREAAELILDLKPAQRVALTVGWLAHAGLKPGESPASSA